MKFLLMIPLVFFITSPHYLMLSIHENFYAYRYGTGGDILNLFYPVFGIVSGTIVSILLIRSTVGTLSVTILGTIIFIFCCSSMLSNSLLAKTTSSYVYKSTALFCGFAIGMVQPNIAAIYGDQYAASKYSIQYFFVYIFTNIIGFNLISAVKLTKAFKTPDITCSMMNCYSLMYLVCVVSSSIGFLFLMILYCMRRIFVVRPIVQHKPFHKSNIKRMKTFALIITPLCLIFLIYILLKAESFKMAKHLNPAIDFFFIISENHLQMVYDFIIIPCNLLAMLISIRPTNGFLKISISCILTCLASFYLDQLYWYIKEQNYIPPVKHPDRTKVVFYAVYYDVEVVWWPWRQPSHIAFTIPVMERSEPIYFNTSEMVKYFEVHILPHQIDYFTGDDLMCSGSHQLWLNSTTISEPHPSIEKSVILHYDMIIYEERLYRVPTGLVLLRIVCDMVPETNSKTAVICLQSSTFSICASKTKHILLEIPSGMYTVTYAGASKGEYSLQNGGYYIFMISSEAVHSKLGDFVSVFQNIPPQSLSVLWLIILYVLMAITNVMIYAGGLDIAYLIGSDDHKSLFISLLYLYYYFAWIGYQIIDNIYKFDLSDSLDIVTFMALLSTLAFYSAYHFWGHNLNRKE